MKAGHGRHPQTAGATPRALPSGAGPHPAEDKEPEQEFVPGLVSRQGFVIPALSGMCWALGKFPAGSREQRGSSHLAPGAAAPHPAGCSVPALQPPLLPRLGSPGQAAPGAPGILRVFLPRRCPEGTGDLPALRFPRWLVRNRSPTSAGSHEPAPGSASSQRRSGLSHAKRFGRILGLSVSFLNAENEEALKNLLFILKAKIPLEFNLPVMDLILLQTGEFFLYHGSAGNSLKQDFVANRVFVPKALSRRCLDQWVTEWPGRGGPTGAIPAP